MKEQQIRDAATLVALRDSPNGPELLMMERTGKAVFAGGCWVFPGGATEESDWDSAWKTHCDPPQHPVALAQPTPSPPNYPPVVAAAAAAAPVNLLALV